MNWRLVVGIVAFFIAVGMVLVVYLVGPDLLVNGAGPQKQLSYQEPSSAQYNPIIRENTHQGTTAWQIPPGKEASIEIQAYANATSVLPGRLLTFYVSTLKEGTPYFIAIYRMGWYGGNGGRLMAPVVEESGHVQGYYDATIHLHPVTQRLIGCKTCLVDKTTGLVEANWKPSYSLYISTDWTTGVYLAKFTDIRGKQTYVPFDVLGNFNSLAVAVTPDTTYEAYNGWGGWSLYDSDAALNNGGAGETDTSTSAMDPTTHTLVRSVKVSFDRPYIPEAGSSQVLIYESDAIHWLERKGYDLAYVSNVDLQTNPGLLLHRRIYISLGHDEYWTKEMRDAVENARDNGVGLAFLGADAAYWQMRFEPDSYGAPNRTVVCYKVDSGYRDLALDPLYGKDNSLVTARWRDPIIGRPENALIGVMFSGLTHRQFGFPWALNTKAQSSVLFGTALLPSRQYGCDLVGYEWDRAFNNGVSPPGLTVLGTSETENNFGQVDYSNTTYYIAASGAMVFATGSIYWTYALDNYRLHFDNFCGGVVHVIPQMQQLMENVMRELVVRHLNRKLTSLGGQSAIALSTPFPPLQSQRYGTLKWAGLLPVCVAVICAGFYKLRRQKGNFARRRFL